jgi:type VI secretion system Hcp family effector
MALPTYLKIQANGEDAPVLFGEDTTQNELGGTEVSSFLQCVEFEVAMEVPQAIGGTGRSGRRSWTPARFVVRLGKSTPWLFDAARSNKTLDLTLYFFRQSDETGEIEQHFQYRVSKGRFVSLRIVHPSETYGDAHGLADFVELQVVPSTSELESVTGSTEMVDELEVR